MENRAVIVRNNAARAFIDRWQGQLALLVASVILLTLALAPIKQFYLAWVGLVPWLWVVGKIRSSIWAFLASWFTGVLYFTANMWWLVYVSAPGTVGLNLYLGLYFAFAAMFFRGLGWVGESNKKTQS